VTDLITACKAVVAALDRLPPLWPWWRHTPERSAAILARDRVGSWRFPKSVACIRYVRQAA